MLTHIVMWKYRPETALSVREQHVSQLQRLGKIISAIQTLSVGFDVLKLARSYDTGLVGTFKDRAALDEYTTHPEHVKVAELGRSISEHVASVDFED